MPDYAGRIAKAQALLRDTGLGGAALAPTDHMRYLTGWAEQGYERLIALFLPASGEPVFVVPELNAEQARANPAGIADVRGWSDASGWLEVAFGAMRDLGFGGRAAVDDELAAAHLLGLQSLDPAIRWQTLGPLLARLREIKDADELEALRRSARVADAAYLAVLPSLRPGITEAAVRSELGRFFEDQGARSWFGLVCFGANSAHPHHHSGPTALREGDVVILDLGCVLDDYASDITRTVAYGEPGPGARQVYSIVLDAHRAAQRAAKPGVACQDVDRAARTVIADAGYGECFIHRTGHGIGLSGHEPPYIVEGNDRILQPGMCFSDEPGIYLPGRYGVRIENILSVTGAGAESLNAAPSERLVVLG